MIEFYDGCIMTIPGAELGVFLKSLLIGLSIAAPVGPIGLLTIQRTLERGRASGLATGMGAAAADAVYGALGAFGVSWLIQWLNGIRVPLALVGGLVLFVLAWRTWHAPVTRDSARSSGRALAGQFAGTFALTLSNPATILSFIAIFGTLAGSLSGHVSPWIMVLGVLLGSALWWLLLTTAVGATRQRFNDGWRHRINQASGAVLAAFALWQWGGLALQFLSPAASAAGA